MTRRHALRREVDVGALRAELATRLGRPVELVTRLPTVDDPDGALIVEDPDGTVLDLAPATIAEVLSAHRIPPTSARQALDDVRAATALAGKLAAIEAYLARLVDTEDVGRAGAREQRRASRRPAGG